jgi:hypothetical protein
MTWPGTRSSLISSTSAGQRRPASAEGVGAAPRAAGADSAD